MTHGTSEQPQQDLPGDPESASDTASAEAPEQMASNSVVEDSTATPPTPSASDGSRSGPGPIRTRNDAYRLLADAADFLIRTDPHSPVPFLVRRAIAWGDMPLTDLVADMIRHDGDLGEINRLLGVNKPGKQ